MKTKSLAPLITSNKAEKLVLSAYRSLYAVLRLFGRNISGEVLLSLASRALVDIAGELILEERKPNQRKGKITLTELGLKTGIDTRVISRLRETPLEISEDDISPEAAILSRWAKDPLLRNPINHKPKDLIIYGRCGTFQGLVLSIAGRGISATAVLERLVERGNVQVVNEHYVRLIDANWQFVDEGEDELLNVAANALSSLAASLRENIRNRIEDRPRLRESTNEVCVTGDFRCGSVQYQLTEEIDALRQELIEISREHKSDPGQGSYDVDGNGIYAKHYKK